jgi:hypothetical protein
MADEAAVHVEESDPAEGAMGDLKSLGHQRFLARDPERSQIRPSRWLSWIWLRYESLQGDVAGSVRGMAVFRAWANAMMTRGMTSAT